MGCRTSITLSALFGVIIFIIILIGLFILFRYLNYLRAMDNAENNSTHCLYDKTGSPNCSGSSCSNSNEICTPPYQHMGVAAAEKQIDALSSGRNLSWSDVSDIAAYSANLISSLERPQPLVVEGWSSQLSFNSKYGPGDRPLGKVFYNDTPNNKYVFIAMRGTARKGSEWSEDFKYELVNVNSSIKIIEGNVHKGFLEIFNDIKSTIKNILQSASVADDTIVVVTGHSLGAALTILVGLFVKSLYKNNKIICTAFGCPRVGDLTFASSVRNTDTIICRFTNTNDIITDSPLPVMPNMDNPESPYIYEHVGIEFRYTENWGSYYWNHFLNTYIQAMSSPTSYR